MGQSATRGSNYRANQIRNEQHCDVTKKSLRPQLTLTTQTSYSSSLSFISNSAM